MASPDDTQELPEVRDSLLSLKSFHIEGLFGGETVNILFPYADTASLTTSVLIIEGRNGTGKTTILKMIKGMLQLNFDIFRKIPFHLAKLEFTDNSILEAIYIPDSPEMPLLVSYRGLSARLPAKRDSSSPLIDLGSIATFRSAALPFLQQIKYELVEIDRRAALRDTEDSYYRDPSARNLRRTKNLETQSDRVFKFLRDVQLDYRRFFRAEELDFLPKLLARMQSDTAPTTQSDLIRRVESIQARQGVMRRFGISNNSEELAILYNILSAEGPLASQQVTLIETYVENQEGIQSARELITKRLAE